MQPKTTYHVSPKCCLRYTRILKWPAFCISKHSLQYCTSRKCLGRHLKGEEGRTCRGCISWLKPRWPSRKRSCSQNRRGCTPNWECRHEQSPSSIQRNIQADRWTIQLWRWSASCWKTMTHTHSCRCRWQSNLLHQGRSKTRWKPIRTCHRQTPSLEQQIELPQHSQKPTWQQYRAVGARRSCHWSLVALQTGSGRTQSSAREQWWTNQCNGTGWASCGVWPSTNACRSSAHLQLG